MKSYIVSLSLFFSITMVCLFPAQAVDVGANLPQLPLYFIENRGQVDEKVLFYTQTPRFNLWITKSELVFDFNGIRKNFQGTGRGSSGESIARGVSKLIFINPQTKVEPLPLKKTDHVVNYYKGNKSENWQKGIPSYLGIILQNLYPGIDLKIYGSGSRVEYDWNVKPGADVADIAFKLDNVKSAILDKEGNLSIKTGNGEIMHQKPCCFQKKKAERISVGGAFREIDKNLFGFQVGGYDRSVELVIDPVILAYSTFLGGSRQEYGESIDLDSYGNIFITGVTASIDFPMINPIQSRIRNFDLYVCKITPNGDSLVYSTFFGGSGEEFFHVALAADDFGNVYVTGSTDSTDFPLWLPLQNRYGGGWADGILFKISPSGLLLFSTYIGGSLLDRASEISLDSTGNAYITGNTHSFDYPLQNPFQAVHKGGNEDVFISKISADGSCLLFSTFLGGSKPDIVYDISVDKDQNSYLTGQTQSEDFPIKDPLQAMKGDYLNDAFVSKLSLPR